MSTDALVAAIAAMTFDVSEAVIRSHVEAAQVVAKESSFPVEILLAITYIETQFADQKDAP